jgi:hypothetical protein
VRIQELLQEDQTVKKRREKVQRQASLLTKLTRQLSIHEARASNAESFSVDANGEHIFLLLSCRTQVEYKLRKSATVDRWNLTWVVSTF